MATAADVPVYQSPRTRLLIVNSTLHIGGAEQVAAYLAERVDARQFEVSACYLKEPGIIAEQMLRAGVDLVPIPGLKPGTRDYFTALKLRRLIRQRDIAVIHTHDIHGMIDGAACRLMTPRVRHIHTFHFGNYPHRKSRHKAIEGTLWRVPDALVAVGHAQAAAIRKLYRIPEDRIRVIWNGVEDPLARTDAPALEGFVRPAVPVIASVSTLIQQKGLEYLLEAAALLHASGEQFQLIIAGEGHLRKTLESQSQRLGLNDHVRFLGWVPQASGRVLPVCDIFVQSSLWEAMSVVVLEAMAAAKPMVVTRVGENPHVVLDGKTGTIVPPADPRALADALRVLLRDATLRGDYGRAARLRYQEHFTIRHMISAHERLYREIAASEPANASRVTTT